jgi:hypothetical protein
VHDLFLKQKQPLPNQTKVISLLIKVNVSNMAAPGHIFF